MLLVVRVVVMPAVGDRPERDRPRPHRKPARGDDQGCEATGGGEMGHHAPEYRGRLGWRNPP